jgi:hypothetical protein
MVKLTEAPEGKSWANILFGEVPAAKRTVRGRAEKRSKSRSKSRRRRSSSPPAVYKNGNIRNAANGKFEVYKKGKWSETEVHNAAGEYGGPYTNARNLQKNPKYQTDMRNIYGAPGNAWEDVVKKMAASRRAEKVAAKAAAKGGARCWSRRTTRRRSSRR